jgi:hypothetical protein
MAIVVATGSAVSVSANSVSAEQISGQYMNIGPGRLTLVVKPSVTGMNCTFAVNGFPLILDSGINWFGTAGSMTINDNILISQYVKGGFLSLKFRNTTAGAITVDYTVLYDPGK